MQSKREMIDSATIYKSGFEREYFEMLVEKKKRYLEEKYPNDKVKEKRCKGAVRFVVYKKRAS